MSLMIPLLISLVVMGGGMILIFQGLQIWRLRRLIELIPASPLGELRAGLVEVRGKAENLVDLTAPISRRPCVYYKIEVQEYSGGRNARWVTVEREISPHPFALRDGTGSVAVVAQGARMSLAWSGTVYTPEEGPNAEALQAYLTAKGISQTGAFGLKKKMRAVEEAIPAGAEVFVLGGARPAGESGEGGKEAPPEIARRDRMMMQALQKLKRDPEMLQRLDLNRDNVVDEAEWRAARDRIAAWLESKSGAASPANGDMPLQIGPAREGEPFYISDRSEREIVRGMGQSAAGRFALGLILDLAGTLFLAFQLIKLR